ncbi:hypothetical protein HYU11_04690 [Candidatus Woesearchaeota archaeon]|nr:hypothetical protein [Candidatus Woesearchaeota archaeon]
MNENESAREIEQHFPVSIFFNEKLSALETITKFLKEEKNLKYSSIAKILNRNERTIWCTYAKAKTKMAERLESTLHDISIPASRISKRELSILETITEYLKDESNLSFGKIASIMRRDYRTIWTVYSRAKKKRRLHVNN